MPSRRTPHRNKDRYSANLKRNSSQLADDRPPMIPSKVIASITAAILSGLAIILGYFYIRQRDNQSDELSEQAKQVESAVSETTRTNSQLANLNVQELEALLQLPTLASETDISASIDIDHWTNQAVLASQQLKENFPNDPKSEHLFGLIQLKLRRTKLAEPSLRRCVKMAPDNLAMRLDLADLLIQLGNDADALEILDALPNQAQPSVAWLLIKGDCQLRLGQVDEAEKSFLEAVKLDARVASHWVKLGNSQLQLGKYLQAEQSGLKAIELSQTEIDAWLLLQQAYSLQRKQAAAESATQRWKDLSGKLDARPGTNSFDEMLHVAKLRLFASTFRSIAVLYQTNQNYDAAQTVLEKSLQLSPQDPVTLSAWVGLLHHQGDFESAAVANRLLMRLQPLEFNHYQNSANLSMEEGKPVEAEAALRLACMRLPTHGYAQLSLARFLLFMNRTIEAQAAAQMADNILNSAASKELLQQISPSNH